MQEANVPGRVLAKDWLDHPSGITPTRASCRTRLCDDVPLARARRPRSPALVTRIRRLRPGSRPAACHPPRAGIAYFTTNVRPPGPDRGTAISPQTKRVHAPAGGLDYPNRGTR